jgi:hypothetical protein
MPEDGQHASRIDSRIDLTSDLIFVFCEVEERCPWYKTLDEIRNLPEVS